VSTEQWFAVQCVTGREKFVQALLDMKGFQTLLPLYRTTGKIFGRNQSFERAVFPGYVFVKLDISRRLPVLMTPKVLQIAGRGRNPVPIPSLEIQKIKALIRANCPAVPCPYLAVGARVTIVHGPLTGVSGILVRTDSRFRLVISVDQLRRSVSVEIDADCIAKDGTIENRSKGAP
jgi:transcription antitermination factor NusG